MIDQEAFARGMNRLALLPTQGGVESDSLASRKILYYEILSPRMSTPQWNEVAHEAFADCRWFPTPRELLDILEGLAPPKLLPVWIGEDEARKSLAFGVDLIRQTLIEKGLLDPKAPSV